MNIELKALGSGNTSYRFDKPDASLLERFVSPFASEENQVQATGQVHIEIPEFTSLCPITGQPDFAKIVINYLPDHYCVESKSLKLYMGSFRNFGEFHESCVNRMINDLVRLLNPHEIQVQGQFSPRGGIPFWPTATWSK